MIIFVLIFEKTNIGQINFKGTQWVLVNNYFC